VGGWSPIGSTWHCGHQQAYCASPGWLWWCKNWWNDWQGKPKYSEKICPSAALSTTNPTCCPDANPGRRCGKPASNRLSYGTAFPRRLIPPGWRTRGPQWRESWESPRIDLDTGEEKNSLHLSEIEPRPSSTSLYRLSCPGFYINSIV
jgi:hypothetical protein